MKSLIVEPDMAVRKQLVDSLSSRNFEISIALTGSEGLFQAKKILPDLIFLADELPDTEGGGLVRTFCDVVNGSFLVLTTSSMPLFKAVLAMKNGAEYVAEKPLEQTQLDDLLERFEDKFRNIPALQHLSSNILDYDGERLVGDSPQIIKLQRLIDLLARNLETPVLVLGESGSGKQLIAEAIHKRSGVNGPMVEINCASLSENLLESELFGHEKGAFTDAREVKKGLFEIAGNGTIFFDELAEMPLAIQAKLLKVLDTGSFRRVGGVIELQSNARVMAATNKELSALVNKGLFRTDLYYRINVLPISAPPLRERENDIIILSQYFIQKLGARMGKRRVVLTSEAAEILLRYDWPGNVRELKNVIERALILSEKGEIKAEHLPAELSTLDEINPPGFKGAAVERTLRQVEEEHILDVIRFTENNHSRAATILGISRSTLLARLNKIKR